LLRRLAVCLAFATCCFLNTWIEFAQGEIAYFARFDPLLASVPAVIIWQILVALVLFSTWELCRRWQKTDSVLIQSAFLVCCFWPFGIAAVAFMRAMPVDLAPIVRQRWFWPSALACASPLVVFSALRPGPAGRFVRALFLYSCPVLALVIIQGFRTTLLKYPLSAYADGPMARRVQPPPSRIRVVWIIFDELSQAITFDHRPPGLMLPEFDRLRSQSFHALAARSPAGSTEESMPALILGEHVLQSDPEGPSSLTLKTSSSSAPIDWSSAPNVFDHARQLGYNSALAGWFHPYGRLLSRSLTECTWTAGWLLSGAEEPSEPEPLSSSLTDRVRLQIAALPLIGHIPGFFPGEFHREEKGKRFLSLLRSACAYASDRSQGLVLIHLPSPHPPAIYSRAERRFTPHGRLSYLDGVALADLALSELRQSIERAGLWDETAVIVSADHGWRTNIWRGGPEWTAEEEAACRGLDTSGVPFLVKLPRVTTEAAYREPFDTVLTARLVLGILQKRVETAAQIADVIAGRTESDRSPGKHDTHPRVRRRAVH
jgi:hypothetical protein